MRTAQAIKHFKTLTALARALNIRPPSICDWGEYPPPARQLQIQELTGGRLKAQPLSKLLPVPPQSSRRIPDEELSRTVSKRKGQEARRTAAG